MTGVGSSNVKTSARAGARIWRGLFLKVVAAELVTFEHAEGAVVDARRRHDDNPPKTRCHRGTVCRALTRELAVDIRRRAARDHGPPSPCAAHFVESPQAAPDTRRRPAKPPRPSASDDACKPERSRRTTPPKKTSIRYEPDRSEFRFIDYHAASPRNTTSQKARMPTQQPSRPASHIPDARMRRDACALPCTTAPAPKRPRAREPYTARPPPRTLALAIDTSRSAPRAVANRCSPFPAAPK